MLKFSYNISLAFFTAEQLQCCCYIASGNEATYAGTSLTSAGEAFDPAIGE